MPDLVRVKDPVSGHQYTTSRAAAKAAGLEVLNKSAVDQIGRPLPAKPHVALTPEVDSKPGRKATQKEES